MSRIKDSKITSQLVMPEKYKWHLLDIEEIFNILNTSRKGLKKEDVIVLQKKYGLNEIADKKQISPLKLFLSQFKNVLILILIAATGISLTLGNIIDAIIIFIVVILCTTIGFLLEYRSEKAIKALIEISAPNATVLRDGMEVKIPVKEVVPGDILILRAGDKVAADARVIESYDLTIDESVLTGESEPVKKDSITLKEDVLIAERINMVYAGTIVLHGRGVGVVTDTGIWTEFGKIADMLSTDDVEDTPLKKRINQIGRKLSIAYIFIITVLFVIGVISRPSVNQIVALIIWSVSLAVAIVPETLPLIITGTLALGAQKMSKNKAIVRRLYAVETLGCITAICSDKTGTLTKNEMTVRKIYVDNQKINVTGTGYEPKGDFIDETGEKIDISQNNSLNMALTIATLCNDSKISYEDGNYRITGNPTDGALVVLAEKASLSKDILEERYKRVGEIPFERERKRMTTVYHDTSSDKKFVFVKGAPEMLLSLTSFIYTDKDGKDFIKEMTPEDKDKILRISDQMATEALRVIAVAYRYIDNDNNKDETFVAEDIERDLIFVGLFGMIDPPRDEVKDAIIQCKKAGIRPIMITGDHKLTAMAIAKELGMMEEDDENKVLTGVDLEKMDEKDLEDLVNDIVVYSRALPIHKLKIIDALKKRGNIVAMTGDGINDAPALKKSDIGIAMNSGTDVAKEASDMVLTDNNFATIVSAIKEGRTIYDNIRKYLVYIFSYGFSEVVILAASFFIGLFLFKEPLYPLMAIQILWANIVIEDLPALGLGVDPARPDIMRQRPRNPNEPILTKTAIRLLIVMIATISIGCTVIFFKYLQNLTKAQTMVFATFILYEMINAFICRSDKDSLAKIEFFSNKWLILGVIGSILLMLLVIQIPLIGQFFYMVPLSLMDWCTALLTALTIIITTEIFKFSVRVRNTS